MPGKNGEKKVKMIKEFESTQEALKFGWSATDKDRVFLQKRRIGYLEKANILHGKNEFDAAMVEAVRAQLDNEAIMARELIADHPHFVNIISEH